MNPYRQLDIQTIQELLDNSQHGFSVFNDGNGLVLDYSKHFDLQNRLNGYLIENFRRLMPQYNIPEQEEGFVTHYVNFGQMSDHILRQELRIKKIELLSLLYQLI